jgi:uroporphyrinogen decarboxylase
MNHRERVLIALNHKAPDRCPMQISFTPEFAKKLSKEMKIQGENNHNPCRGGNTYKLELALDEDMLLTSVGWADSYYQSGFKNSKEYIDEWGIRWKVIQYDTKYGKGKYTEIIEHPLANDDIVNNYIIPDPNRQELYREAQKLIDNCKIDYFIVGVTVTTIFETAWALRGMEKLLMDDVFATNLEEFF